MVSRRPSMTKEDMLQSQALAATDHLHVDDSEASESDEPLLNRQRHSRPQNWRLLIALFSLSMVLSNILSGTIGLYLGRKGLNLDSECASYTTQYSPVITAVDVKYTFQEFNGSFMEEDAFRKKGAPDVDAAWESLGVDYRAGVISSAEGLRSGLTPAHVQRSARYGGGYFVNVEGLHHLHCLNLVRKSLYYNYDYYKALGTHAFTNEDDIVQLHVSHCLDTIRQVLMCNADTGVLGQVWYNKEKPKAFPDFHTTHKCKNYDAIRKWAEEHQEPPVDTLPPDYMQMPKGEDVWPTTP